MVLNIEIAVKVVSMLASEFYILLKCQQGLLSTGTCHELQVTSLQLLCLGIVILEAELLVTSPFAITCGLSRLDTL